MTIDLRTLLRDLHAVGWRYTREWVPMDGRDPDGAPWTDNTWDVHRWSRGTECIEAYWDRASGTGLGWIHFDPNADEGYDDNLVSLGSRRAEEMGVAGLHRLAVALGAIGTAPTRCSYWWCNNCTEEVDASRVTFQEMHDSCGFPVETRTAAVAT